MAYLLVSVSKFLGLNWRYAFFDYKITGQKLPTSVTLSALDSKPTLKEVLKVLNIFIVSR